jgi:hypothetical protein
MPVDIRYRNALNLVAAELEVFSRNREDGDLAPAERTRSLWTRAAALVEPGGRIQYPSSVGLCILGTFDP